MAPFTRVVPGTSVGARSSSLFQRRSGTHSCLYSHCAAAELYLPTAASHQATHTPQAPDSPKVQGSLQAPSLHQQNAAGEGREEEWEREKLRCCRAGPEGAGIRKRQARTAVNRQEEGE